jgi:hypothetical protein
MLLARFFSPIRVLVRTGYAECIDTLGLKDAKALLDGLK